MMKSSRCGVWTVRYALASNVKPLVTTPHLIENEDALRPTALLFSLFHSAMHASI
jgi:hypothetical protein